MVTCEKKRKKANCNRFDFGQIIKTTTKTHHTKGFKGKNPLTDSANYHDRVRHKDMKTHKSPPPPLSGIA